MTTEQKMREAFLEEYKEWRQLKLDGLSDQDLVKSTNYHDFCAGWQAAQAQALPQPISTAPRDGTTIMLWLGDKSGWWWGHYEDGRGWMVKYGATLRYAEPTHWLLVPAAPQPDKGE